MSVLLCFGKLSGGEAVIDKLPNQVFNPYTITTPVNPAKMASITASTDGDWNDVNTWLGGIVPTSSDDVTIPAGITVTISSTSAGCNSLNISGELNLTDSYNLTIADQLTLSGEITTGTGNVILSNSDPNALIYTSGSITGNFRRAINTAGVNYLFPIGDGSTPAILRLNFASITTAGEITVATAEILPGGLLLDDNNTSGEIFISSNSVAFSTISGSYTLTSAWASNQRVGLYNGSSWYYIQPPGPTASFSGWNSINNVAFALADCLPPEIILGGIPEICAGTTSIELPYSVANGSPIEYSIDFANASITDVNWTSLSTSPITVTLPGSLTAGTYAGTLKVRNVALCESSSTDFNILINPLLAVSVTIAAYQTTVCANTSVTFTATPTNGGSNPAYQWKVNGSNQGTNSPTFSYTPTNGDDVSVEMTSSENCTSGNPATSNTIEIVVNPNLPVSVSISANQTTVCENTSVTFTASPTNGGSNPTYQWKVNGSIQGTNSPTFTYTPTNGDDVSVEMTSSENCTSGNPTTSNVISITVNPKPTVTANPANPNICSGTAPGITLSSNVSGTTFAWTVTQNGVSGASIGDGSTINQTLTATGNAPGTVTYTITPTANGCAGDPIDVVVTVNPIPTVSATNLNQTICPGGSIANIVITNPNGIAGTTYSWTRDNASIITGIPASGTSATISGTLNSTQPQTSQATIFTIIATANGCTSNNITASVTVIDNQPPTFNLPSDLTVYTDDNCNIDTTTSRTGFISTYTDDCTSPSNLHISYKDQDFTTGACPGSFSYNRIWTVKDLAGNATTKTQKITVSDNDGPILSIPANITVQCGTELTPVNTGMATAVDRCNNVSITPTYTDSGVASGCSYVITRTWRAADACGNTSTAVQTITVSDTKKPTIVSINHQTVDCPADIPLPDPSVISATDECGTINIILYDEVANGLDDKPGYCPTSMVRTYRVSDGCGNFIDAVQNITILGLSSCWEAGTCEACSPSAPNTNLESFYTVDLSGNPDSIVFFEDIFRQDKCCDAKKQEYCASFNVLLDEDAVGVEVQITNPAPPGQAWVLDCGETSYELDGGKVVCLPGGQFHLFTYCAAGQGNNRYNDWKFISHSGVVVEQEIETRVSCETQIDAQGIYSDPVWTSIYPTDQDYTQYLYAPGSTVPGSGKYITDPVFIAPPGAIGEFQFEVCGVTGVTTYCTEAGGTDCDIVTLYVVDAIEIDLNLDPQAICATDIPVTIQPDVYPLGGTYLLEWYKGSVATGTPYIGTSYEISEPGEYLLVVVDTQEGIRCSEKAFPFNIELDLTGPTYQVLPDTLYIECNASDANQLITDWLESARATYTNASGTVITITPTNNFSFSNFNHSCGNVHVVEFTAFDNCSNDSVLTSAIVVTDNVAPEWLDSDNALDRTISCDDDINLGLAQSLEPLVFDTCDPTSLIQIVKTPGEFVPSVECANEGTYTNTWIATDDCGNTSAVFTQIITIIDETSPTITCVTPEDDIAEPDICKNEHVLLTPPTFSDLCGTSTLSWVLSGDTNGEGGPELPTIFNVGLTTVTWIVTDACGLTATCEQEVIISDEQDPILTCPSSFSVGADHLQAYASLVNVPAPTHDDNCDYILTWQITLNGNLVSESTNTTGQSTVPSPYPQLYIGDNIVTYTLTDINGVDYTCSFTITVENEPELECPDTPITLGTDPGNCTSLYDPEEPILLEGSQPITWVYTITGPDGTVEETVTFVGSEANPGPPQIGPYEFSLGTTTIHWTATNLTGTDECLQTIIVEDNQPPHFTPPDAFEFCVENLFLAQYNGSDLDIEPIPDHYLLNAGSDELDLDMSLFTDNCCLIDTHPYGIRWEIEFSTGEPSVSGTGQPSTYGSDIPLWGDGTTYQNVVHTITYWVSDCHGVETGPFVVEITIKPRPQIIKY